MGREGLTLLKLKTHYTIGVILQDFAIDSDIEIAHWEGKQVRYAINSRGWKVY